MAFRKEKVKTADYDAVGTLDQPEDVDLGLVEEIGSDRRPTVLPRFPCSSFEEMEEIRDTFRIPLTVPVTVDLPDGSRLETCTLNASTGGIAFAADESVPQESAITLTMSLEGSLLSVPARVRHASSKGNRTIVGAQFTGLDRQSELAVNRVVAAQDRRLRLRALVTTGMQYRIIGESEAYRRSTTSDICLGGVRFHVVPKVKVGDRIEVLIYLGRNACTIQGVAFRIDDTDGDRQAAVCFDTPSTPAEERTANNIRSFLADFRSLAD